MHVEPAAHAQAYATKTLQMDLAGSGISKTQMARLEDQVSSITGPESWEPVLVHVQLLRRTNCNQLDLGTCTLQLNDLTKRLSGKIPQPGIILRAHR